MNHNCVRVTERGEEVSSETASRWTRTGYEAVPIRASRLETAKLLWLRIRRRKSGGCAVKDRVLTWGDLALCLKGRRWALRLDIARLVEREVSHGHTSRYRTAVKG